MLLHIAKDPSLVASQELHRKWKWLKWVWKSPLLQVLLESFSNEHLKKYSSQMSLSIIKFDLSLLREKWESLRQNSIQIAVFMSIIWFFSSKPKLSLLFSYLFDSISVFNPDFCMPQNCLSQAYWVWNKSQIYTHQLHALPDPCISKKMQYYEFHMHLSCFASRFSQMN